MKAMTSKALSIARCIYAAGSMIVGLACVLFMLAAFGMMLWGILGMPSLWDVIEAARNGLITLVMVSGACYLWAQVQGSKS